MTPAHDTAATAAPAPPPARLSARDGAFMIARGAAGAAFGLATVFWPRVQLASAAQLAIGVRTAALVTLGYLLVAGILLFLQSVRQRGTVRLVLQCEAIIVLPAAVFLLLAQQPGQLRAAVCIWALLHGLLELWMYRVRRAEPMAADFLISAGLHVLLAVIVGFGTQMAALSVFGFAGAAVLIVSVLFIVGGATRRMRARKEA
ncbi:hypothetical protein BRM1_09255 [Brevibacterium sp. BRM-1]|uniref:hypothetical protein n=1 Tax=Brevibacterium sp. BRM-1 TaxID=2999062 RepID=UPI002282F4A6|nr:hypothetical protein [Brevibacterium sp. BRM-1]WAL39464.1 hypothetical protein BRM1_09255 [Brevibacterium sp. BRM-1]